MRLKKTFRAMLLAETLNNSEREALGKNPIPFSLDTQQQVVYYLYAIYATSNPDKDITYDSFLEKMDDPKFYNELSGWMDKELKESALTADKKKEKKVKK